MQLMEHWSNMAKLALLNNKSGGCILNSLQFEAHRIIDYCSSLFGY